jgi:hypothetical protein
MFKRGLLVIVSIITIYLIIDQTILSKEEKPDVRFELADKTIPYKITNYSWGKVLNKDKKTNKNSYTVVKDTKAIKANKGEYVHIHFSEQPENVEIIELTSTNKRFLYDQSAEDYEGYSFQLDSHVGERIFEVRGIWKGNNYYTYLIKLTVL